MVRRNLLINNILSEPQNEVCYEENQTYRFHKGNQGPYRFHETKGTIYSKKKKIQRPEDCFGPPIWPPFSVLVP